MTGDAKNRLEQLFASALKLPTDQREEFAERECADDEALLNELMGLLRHDQLAANAKFLHSDYTMPPSADRDTVQPTDVSTEDNSITCEPIGPSWKFDPESRRIGHYELIEPLGKGGFGTVWLAEDSKLQRRVAIKLASARRFPSRQQLAMLIREARSAGQFDGRRGLVTVHDIIPLETIADSTADPSDAPVCAIVMEYVQGHTLAEVMKSGKVPHNEAAEIIAKVADALVEPHRRGIVHRDLKPGNVLLDPQKQPVIVDFGLAVREQSLRLRSNELCGTPAYMSPEQIRGDKLDGRSDIWSLGVILYEMLTGRRPFEDRTFQQTLDEIKTHEPKPPRQLDDGIPRELERICLGCLSKSVADRYLSATDLAKDLRRWQRPSRRSRAFSIVIAIVAILLISTASAWFAAMLREPAFEPLSGDIDVRIWNDTSDHRSNLSLKDAGALPLLLNDQIRIEAELNRPAYMYIAWIDTEGNVQPVYPRSNSGWGQQKEPLSQLSLPEVPEDLDKTPHGYRYKESSNGIETLILLARDTPLPNTDDLQTVLSDFPPIPVPHTGSTVFDRRRIVPRFPGQPRAPDFTESEPINDTYLRTQHKIVKLLGDSFPFFHGVAFSVNARPGIPLPRKNPAAPKKPGTQGDRSTKRSDRHALLVGCSEYPNANGVKPLYGPTNDVQLMRTLLTGRFDFRDEQIVVLTEQTGSEDHRPLRANIQREFERLAQIVKSGDQVVIFLAGHGSQQPDDDKDDPEDIELDGFDEIFLPADVGEWVGNKQCVRNAITDDEIGQWLDAICRQDAFVWFVVDACHSGTMIRGAGDEVLRQVPVERLVPQHVLREAKHRTLMSPERRAVSKRSRNVFDLADNKGRVVALYAAQPNELTTEYPMPPAGTDRKWYGLLTYTVSQILTQAPIPPTYRDLARAVHDQYVRLGRTSPTPLLEGANLDRKVLGQEVWQRPPIRLSRDYAGSYSIDAGALHGLTSNSVLQVRRTPGAHDSDRILGHVRIEAVRPFDCLVEPCDYYEMPANQYLPHGAVCRLVYHDYGDMHIQVAIDRHDANGSQVSQELTDELIRILRRVAGRKGALVQLTATETDADWLLRVQADQVFLVPGSGWPLGAAGGTSDSPPSFFGPTPITDDLADWLEKRLYRIARVQNLLNLGTIDWGEGDCDIEVKLVHYPSGITAQYEEVKWENGRTLRVGDFIQFHVSNKGQHSVDVTMLFVDSEYRIGPLPPRPGFLPRLQHGDTLESVHCEVEPAPCPLHVVVIAVRSKSQAEPIDFSWLAEEHPARRGQSSFNSPLGNLLHAGLSTESQTRGLTAGHLHNYVVRWIAWTVNDSDE